MWTWTPIPSARMPPIPTQPAPAPSPTTSEPPASTSMEKPGCITTTSEITTRPRGSRSSQIPSAPRVKSTYSYVNHTPMMEYDADGLEAVSYMMQHDGRPHTEPPPPGVTPQAKALICKAINQCSGDMGCVFRHLNRDRKNRQYPGGPIDPNKWNAPDLRDAEDFALKVASRH